MVVCVTFFVAVVAVAVTAIALATRGFVFVREGVMTTFPPNM